jgi:protein-S-isoprenylcysteine O-methyltransferase Ste14
MNSMRKLLLVLVFVLLTVATAAPASEAVSQVAATGTFGDWLRLTFILLKVAVIATFTTAVIARGDAKERTRDPLAFAACTVAVVATIPLQPPDEWSSASLMLCGELIALVSAIWVFAAAINLGRSFGVLPEARELVTEGLYSRIRHPIYLGEFGMFAGLLIAAPTAMNVVAMSLFILGQAVRVRLEEAALLRAFPEYAEYAAITPRFIPRPRLGTRPIEPASAEAA